jgi:TonB family protein
MRRAPALRRLLGIVAIAVTLASCSSTGARQPGGLGAPVAETMRADEDAPSLPRIFRHDEIELLPQLLVPLEPVYPRRERRLGLEGEVECRLVVRADGRAGSVEMLHTSGASFERAVVEALRSARFRPGVRRGKPVSAYLTLRVAFVLD